MASSKVAIVIPAFNEELTIGKVISEINFTIPEVTIVVVNDCSNDKTAIKARNAGAIVVDLMVNHGYSRAIEQGFHFCVNNMKVDYVITMDADGQHHPESVRDIFTTINEPGIELVIGKRQEFARISEKLFGTYFNYKFGITDPLCGLKAYNISLFKKYDRFESYDSIGTELMSLGLANHVPFREIPVIIRQRGDEPRFGGKLSANKRIFKSLIKSIYHNSNW
ncbi:glycosyltransferase family 2 protein [Vibrio sp. 10N.286.52.C3]|uniref:glycosyltransferase family 2 protein n=1 Tax=Vibrio sp. 10N.286.52.C3 TaxID=3229713 RepID=UPI00354FA476